MKVPPHAHVQGSSRAWDFGPRHISIVYPSVIGTPINTRVAEVSAADVSLGPTLDWHYSDVGRGQHYTDIGGWRRRTATLLRHNADVWGQRRSGPTLRPTSVSDVSQGRHSDRCWRPTSAADIFQSSFLAFTPMSSSNVGPAGRHSGQRRPPKLSV